jgi:hypothetical protein
MKVLFRQILPDVRNDTPLAEGTQDSLASPYERIKVSLQRWWNDSDEKNKSRLLVETSALSLYFNRKSHMDWRGFEKK